MKKLFFGFVLFTLYCFVNAATADNEFCFKYKKGISSVNLSYNGIYKDSNEFGEVSYSTSKKKSCISVKSKRTGSEAIANSFNQLVSSNDNKYVLLIMYGSKIPAFPQKLNFYLGVDVSINGIPLGNNMFLAQGHYSSGNNWWVATNSGIYKTCGYEGMTLTDSANNKYCIKANGTLNEVTIRAGQCYEPYNCY